MNSCRTRFPLRAYPILLLFLIPEPAAGQAPRSEPVDPWTEKIRIGYQAIPDCPSSEAFMSLVRSRLPAGWEALPGELARPIHVTVARAGAGFVATAEVTDAGGQPFTRTVQGKACSNVVDGIALVTALAIQSRIEEAFARSEPLASVPPEPAGESSTSAPKVQPSMQRLRPAPTRPPPVATPSHRTSAPVEGPLHVRFGGRAAIATGIGPDAAFGPGVFGTLELSRARLGVTIEALDGGRVIARGIPARFGLISARFEGCSVVFDVLDWGAAEACAFAELGSVWGRAFSDPPRIVEGKRGMAPWAAPGALGRFAAGLGPLVLVLEVMGRVPVWTERFYVQNSAGYTEDVYQVPRVAVGGAAGIGLRL